MGHQEVNHRSDPLSGHPHILQESTDPQLLHTPQTNHAHVIQPRSQVPSQSQYPHAIPFDAVQHMQNPVLQYPVQETQFMPGQHQQANVVYYASAPPIPTASFQHASPYVPANMVQPPPRVTTAGTEGWTTGLFDCLDDPTNGLILRSDI